MIVNEAGATLATTAVDSKIVNEGRIEHAGALANTGIVQNLGAICGSGSLTGNPIVGNDIGEACGDAVFTCSFEDEAH